MGIVTTRFGDSRRSSVWNEARQAALLYDFMYYLAEVAYCTGMRWLFLEDVLSVNYRVFVWSDGE